MKFNYLSFFSAIIVIWVIGCIGYIIGYNSAKQHYFTPNSASYIKPGYKLDLPEEFSTLKDQYDLTRDTLCALNDTTDKITYIYFPR